MSEQPEASAERKRFCQLLAQLAQEHDRLESECQSLRRQGGALPRKAPVVELPEESGQLDLPTDVCPCAGDVMGKADTARSGSESATASRRVAEGLRATISEPVSCVDGTEFGSRHSDRAGRQGMGGGTRKCTLVSIGDALEEAGPNYDAAVSLSNQTRASRGGGGATAGSALRMGPALEVMTDEWMEQRHIETLGPAPPHRCIFSPIGKIRIFWEVLWCLALCFDLWQVPFRIIFCEGPVPDELERLNLSVNVFFLADIIMNFNTGYIDHVRQLLVMNRPRIAMNYLTGWFFVDFISSLPWEYLDTGESVQTVRALKINKVTRAFRVMRSLKLVRAVKIVNTIKNWSRLGILPLYQVDPKTPTAVHRLFGERMGRRYELARDTCMLPIQALFLLAMLAHFFGCVRGAALHAVQESYWDALDTFLECFSWAYSLLTFGSAAQPTSPAGRWLQLSVLTVRGALAAAGAFWFAFSAIIFHQRNTGFHVHNESVARYLRTRGIGPNTQMSVMRHLEATGPERRLRDHFHQVVESFLPEELRMSIREEMWVPRLMSLGLIREIASWSDLFVGQLAQLVQEELYASHAVVFKHGDVASAAYQIFDGSVVIMALAFDEPHMHPAPLTSGMWLGEKAFLADVASEFKSRVREAQQDDGYLLFLSHYKVEAGTEAALMRTELEHILGESGLANETGVFLDSEDLTTLVDLQDAVRKSKNIAVLLTANVLTRPWVLVELATAYKAGIPVLTVLLSKQGTGFTYPTTEFYDSLLDGSLLGESGTNVIKESGFDMETVVVALKAVLQRISLPYSPHRPASIRRAELCALIQQCTLHVKKVRGVGSPHASGWFARAKRLRKSDTWVANLLTKG